MPDIDQEELFVDIPDSGQSIVVEVEPLELSPDDPGFGTENPDEEHLEYSKKVKRRIDKLTKKAREMERQQAAAIDYARNIQAENNQLRTRVQDLDQGYVAEYGDRIATQSDSLSRDLETAIATNDTSAQVALNKKLYQLAIEEERVSSSISSSSISSNGLGSNRSLSEQIPRR
jgi:cell division protein FtsB